MKAGDSARQQLSWRVGDEVTAVAAAPPLQDEGGRSDEQSMDYRIRRYRRYAPLVAFAIAIAELRRSAGCAGVTSDHRL